MDWLHLLELAATAAGAGWGAFERARSKRREAERIERERARRELLRQQLHGIEVRSEAISSILDKVKDFDALWRPIKKAAK
jgi:hypothetical protein